MNECSSSPIFQNRTHLQFCLSTFTDSYAREIKYNSFYRCHPFLDRKAKRLMQKLWNNFTRRNRVGIDDSDDDEYGRQKKSDPPDWLRTINGEPLPTKSERKAHFDMLEKFWNP